MTSGYADLHLHTVASDGTTTIREQVRRAKAAGLSCIAITDHDVIAPEVSGRVRMMDGVEVITGVEIKADFEGITGEVLGYFVDPECEEMRSFLASMKTARIERMEEMIRRCREELKIELDLAEVRAVAEGNLGRPHLARVLMNRGLVANLSEAFNKLLKRGAPCYAPIDKDGFRDVTDIIHRAGGVASLPHPCLMKVPDWDRFLDMVADAGMDGIEVFYAYDPASRGVSIEPRMMQTMAEKRGFLLTGGSDDHGPDSTKESIGRIRVPYERVEALRAALPVPV